VLGRAGSVVGAALRWPSGRRVGLVLVAALVALVQVPPASAHEGELAEPANLQSGDIEFGAVTPSRPAPELAEGVIVARQQVLDPSREIQPRSEPKSPAVPSAPRSVRARVKTGHGETLSVSWNPPERSGGAAVTDYVVQWKQSTAADWAEKSVGSQGSVNGSTEISGLVDGESYSVRVLAVNSAGRGAASATVTAVPLSGSEQFSRYLDELVLEIGDEHPWFVEAVDYLREQDVEFRVASLLYLGSHSMRCRHDEAEGIPMCRTDRIDMDDDHVRHKATAVHEVAHSYTLSSDAAAAPAPIAVAHVYFGRLIYGRSDLSTCTSEELYADVIESYVAGGDPSYWPLCDAVPDSPTAEAEEIVRAALAGEMPAWFYDTYGRAGGLDLELLWADMSKVSRYTTAQTVFAQMRDAFGGYCSPTQAYDSMFYTVGPLRNPWVDGGCVPQEPTKLTVAGSDGRILVCWAPPAYDGGRPVTEYVVQWKSPADEGYGPSRQKTVAPGGTLSAEISGLDNGVAHQVRVVARNGFDDGDDATSNDDWGTAAQTIATPRAGDLVAAPSGVSASSTDVSATLSWVVPAQPGVYLNEMFLERLGDGCEVEWSTRVIDDWELDAESSWSEKAGRLEADTEYRFRVRLATDGHGDVFSETITVSTQSEPPVAPSDLTASVGDDGQVNLSWTIPAQPSWVEVGTVMVERRDSGGVAHFGAVAEVDWERGTTSYSATDGSPLRGLPYEYRVRMLAGGRFIPSDTVSVTVPAQVETTAGPLAGFSLIDASNQSLRADIADGDTVELAGAGSGDFAVRADIADGERVGSVYFELTGPVSTSRTESWLPYALYGDAGTNNLYGGGPLPPGEYTLTATAYSLKYRRGDTLGTLSVTFDIVEDTS